MIGETLTKKNLDTHPIVILEDGSIVYTIHNTGFGTRIIKTSYCNDILWSNEASYHHSLALDSNQNIWTINAEESFVLINKNNGNIIKEIFLKDIIKKKQAIYDLKVDKRINKIGNGSLLENYPLNNLPNYLQNNKKKYQEWID